MFVESHKTVYSIIKNKKKLLANYNKSGLKRHRDCDGSKNINECVILWIKECRDKLIKVV